jgi:hypothetical protein
LRQAVRVSLRQLLKKKVRFKTGGCAEQPDNGGHFDFDHVVVQHICFVVAVVWSGRQLERWSRQLVSRAKEHAAGFEAAMGKEGGSGSGQ